MKLSIITINYNNKEGLQKTIDSVICQTWKDYEWLLIDGGSTDGSKELIEQYQEHFAYWCSESDKGIYNAMNKGIVKAQGEFLLFLNSGDCLHERTVLEQVLSENMIADVVYGAVNFLMKDGNRVLYYPDRLTMHYFLCYSLGHPASFIRAKLFDRNGYREDFRIISDWCKFVEWFREGKVFKSVNVVIADFDTTGMSSVNADRIYQEKRIFLNDFFGKENHGFIEESMALQKLYDEVSNSGFLQIKECGGRRYSVLLRFISFLRKSSLK